MLEKGKKYEIRIHDFSHNGEGVGRIDGIPVFVPGLLPGEKAQIRLTEVKKRFARGGLLELESLSPERRTPPCPVYERCGGCSLQHLSDAAQLEMKRNKVQQALKRIGGQEDLPVTGTWGMDDPWRYRNKVQFQVHDSQLGYFSYHTHRFVPIQDCLLLPGDMVALKKRIENFLHGSEIRPEQVILRKSHLTGTFMVLFQGSRPGRHLLKTLGETLGRDPEISSLGWVESSSHRYSHVYGQDYMEEEILGLSFRISPQSFAQINHVQMENLYRYVLDKAEIRPTDLVLDLYCGIGTLTCLAARKAQKAVGIEQVHAAIADARLNARNNGLENLTFHSGDAEALLPELVSAGMVPDVVILDPPRAGARKEVLDALLLAGPRTICYISCDPATLARDLEILTSPGDYRIHTVKPVDLFCQTHHVECVVLMSRVEK